MHAKMARTSQGKRPQGEPALLTPRSWAAGPSDLQGQGLLLLKSPPGALPSGQSRLKCVLNNPRPGLASLLNFKWDGDVQGYV